MTADVARKPSRALLLALGLHVGCAAAASVGLGTLVQSAYPVLAVVVALVLLSRRRGAGYVEFVLWLWLLSPWLRRVVDLDVGYTAVSPVMAAAPLATLICLLPGLRGRRRLQPAIGRGIVVAFVCIGYATAVGVLRNGSAPALAGMLGWLPPLALGLYVATAGPDDDQELRAVLRRTAVVGSVVLGGYGLAQFFLLPDWDVLWMRNAGLNSIGRREPLEVRVFSTLNAPAPFASVLGVLLVLLTGIRSRQRSTAGVLGVAALGLSLVRTAWLGAIVALLSLLAPGRGRLLRAGLAGLLLPLALILTFGGPVREALVDRVTASAASGSRDVSLSERLEFHRDLLPRLVADPVGSGLGSVGVATKLSRVGAQVDDFDGGDLEVLLTFGLLLGTAVMVSLAAALAAAYRRSHQLGDLERAMAAALLGLAAQLPFANPLVGPVGVLFWLLLGTLARCTPDASSGVPCALPANGDHRERIALAQRDQRA